ncbi:MAG: hypothetical protein H6727_06520 [Myxococcales bacterium]|nr:hypothetical protein [Myxococcales bacterium]
MLTIPDQHLERYEQQLDPEHPEEGEVPAKVLGYGEMSTILTFPEPHYTDYAFKRMAIFHTTQEVEDYKALYTAYNEQLTQRGLQVPLFGLNCIQSPYGLPVLYLSQERLEGHSIGNQVIRLLPEADALRLLQRVLSYALPLYLHNRDVEQTGKGTSYGLDMQISNWSAPRFDPQSPSIREDEPLFYIDTSTPLMRIDGKEQLNTELFLRICPAYLVWLIRWLFLEDVVTRYYNFRLAVLDLLANLLKEGREDLLPSAIKQTNAFFAEQAATLGCNPLTEKEIRSYYKEDAWIWRIFLSFRRLERFVKRRIQRKPYPIILPGPIKR